MELSSSLGVDIVSKYSNRIALIAETSVVADGKSAANRVLEARTFRELQRVQVEHDRVFHADVFGLSRIEQLRHYVLHLAKIAGGLAALSEDESKVEDFQNRRLPDLLLFGIKLSTVMGEALPSETLTR